jgi:hypothetical protein
LGYETYWFDDANYPDNFDWNDCVFWTEGFADKNIPLNKTSTYFVHVCPDPAKYINVGVKKFIDVRYNHLWHKDHVYDYTLDKSKVENVGPCCYLQPKKNRRIQVLNDYHKYWIEDYDKFYVTWATNILPEEFNFDDRFLKRDNKFYFVGTLGGSPALEMQKVVNTLQQLNIEFVNFNPWQNPLTFEQNMELMKKSVIALDVRGSDAYHTNSGGMLEVNGKPVTGGNHKKIGYIPCRLLKQISYGRMPGTNSAAVRDLLGDYVIYNDDESQLPVDCLRFERNPNHDLVYEAMKHVQENHTFINRAKALTKIFNREV